MYNHLYFVWLQITRLNINPQSKIGSLSIVADGHFLGICPVCMGKHNTLSLLRVHPIGSCKKFLVHKLQKECKETLSCHKGMITLHK